MTKPAGQVQPSSALGSALMLKCNGMQVPAQDIAVIASIAVGAVRALYGDAYTDDQLSVCVMAAKAGYLAGKERREFVGYG